MYGFPSATTEGGEYKSVHSVIRLMGLDYRRRSANDQWMLTLRLT